MSSSRFGSNIRITHLQGAVVVGDEPVIKTTQAPMGVLCDNWHSCRDFAVAENGSCLSQGDSQIWFAASEACGNKKCLLHKGGRQERSTIAAREVQEVANQRDREELERMSRDWVDAHS